MRYSSRRGQVTIEYILVLTVSVLVFTIVATKLIRPAGQKISDAVSGRISEMFSKNAYQIRLRR